MRTSGSSALFNSRSDEPITSSLTLPSWDNNDPHPAREVTNKRTFDAELIEGHKGVTVVIVPFDPEESWREKPVRLEGRRHGWLISGTVNGVRFDGYVGERWGRFFIIIDAELRETANVSVGDTLHMIVQPAKGRGVFERALELSKLTTQPGKARPDAINVQLLTDRR
jgi:hypothetical protein